MNDLGNEGLYSLQSYEAGGSTYLNDHGYR